MSFAGKLARGLFQGASGYFGDVAEQQEYDRRASILAQREEALERLRRSVRRTDPESLQGFEAKAGAPSTGISSPGPGDLSANGRAVWDGRAWVPITAASWPEQQGLERNGQ